MSAEDNNQPPQENGSANNVDVPEIELIIKVTVAEEVKMQ